MGHARSRFSMRRKAAVSRRRLLMSSAGIIFACSAQAAGSRTLTRCTDTLFTSGFDEPAVVHEGRTAPAALMSDGFQFFALNPLEPGSLTPIGSTANASWLLAFADGNFDRVFGLARGGGTMPSTFASIRTSDGSIVPIGNSMVSDGDWSGLRQDPTSGTLYAIATTCGSSSTLYTIDRNSAAVHRVHELVGLPCAISIAISPRGVMYTVDPVSDNLFVIDPDDGSASLVGALGFDTGALDMDFDGMTGELYAIALNNSAQRVEMRVLDTSSGGSAFVGQVPVNQFSGFAIENDVVCTQQESGSEYRSTHRLP